MGENLMEFSIVDENEVPCDEDEENYQPPTIIQSPVVTHSILKPSNKDNLIQLYTPKPTNKNLKVKFQTPQPKNVTPTRYEEIRSLDEVENWVERTTVVTKQQHTEYTEYAKDILIELIDNLPVIMLSPSNYSTKVVTECGGSKLENSVNITSEPSESLLDSTLVNDTVIEVPTDGAPLNQEETKTSADYNGVPLNKEGTPTATSDKYEPEKTENFIQHTDFINEAKIPKSPPLSTRGGYNIDFDNLDDINPFATKSAVSNSPVCADSNVSNNNKLSNKENEGQDVTVIEQTEKIDDLSEIDPFKPKSQILNSPIKQTADESDSEPEFQDALSDVESDKDSNKNKLTEMLEKDAESESTLDLPENQLSGKSPRLFDQGDKDVLGEIVASQTDDIFSQSFDDIDPFKPAVQLPNSPSSKGLDLYTDNGVSNNQSQSLESVESAGLIAEKDGNLSTDQKDLYGETETKGSHDKLESSKQIENTLSNLEEIDPFKPSKQVMNSPDAKSNDIDPFKPSTQIMNSPDAKSNDIDPFKPSTQIMNSPVAQAEEIDPFKASKQIMNSPAAISNDIDPFKPSTQIMNSPDVKVEEIDPFKPSKYIMNSPAAISNAMDPFKPSTQIMNSPDIKAEEIDPFKPSKQIMNSPDVKPNDIDPFKSSKQIMNSPSNEKESVDPKLEINVQNLSKTEESEPVKVEKKLSNSPKLEQQTETAVHTQQIIDDLDIDPFKPKTQIVNSPIAINKEDIDPFKPKSQIMNSPTGVSNEENVDPFKPKTQIMNSPVLNKEEIVDPFKPKAQIMNSPAGISNEENIDPFEPKAQIVNSPVVSKEEIVDPFKPKTLIINSPVGINNEENIDPFKPKTQMMNSPVMSKQEIENPFQPKTQIMNSPLSGSTVENASVEKNSLNMKTEKDIESTLTAATSQGQVKSDQEKDGKSVNDELSGKADEVKSKESDDKPSALPASSFRQGFEIEEDMFKPASEIFNSPSAWDMLEQFGSGSATNTDLTRQSLYVKFDPLVNLPLNDPRRASIGLRRSSIGIRTGIKPTQFRDLNPEESFLLLGTPPNQRSRRITNLGTKSIPEEGTPKSCKGPVDLLSCSPAVGPHKVVREEGEQAVGKDVLNVVSEQTDSGIVQVLQYTEEDMQKLRQVMAMEFQGILMSKEKEWSKLVNDKDKEKQAETQKLTAKQKHLEKTTKDLENMMLVVGEYEKIINQLIGEKEKNTDQFKESSSELKKERDQALEDVQTLENSFADLHKRYEKLRAALDKNKKNEDILKKCVEDYRTKAKKTEEKLVTLKQDAEEKLKKASQEIDKMKSEREAEIAKLEAALKRKEMQIDSLQKSYDQKVKENQELTDLCDQLIGKVGK